MNLVKIISAFALVGVISTSCGQTKKEASDSMDEASTEMMEVVEETVETPNIVGVAAGNENFTTLVAAVKAADLVATLSGDGPFTVFAPVNKAFEILPEGTVATLLKPENKKQLQTILTYHVVAGKVSAADLIKMIKDNDGKVDIETVNGGTISAWMKDRKVYISDENGGKAVVTIADVNQSNGVIHVIDSVLLPKS